MLCFTSTVSFFAMCLISQPVAQTVPSGLIQRFPKDGTWVRYSVSVTNKESDTLVTGFATVRFVGSVKMGNQHLRWIEVESVAKKTGDGLTKSLSVVKMLVTAPSQSDKTAPSVVRGWIRKGPSLIRELTKAETALGGRCGFFFGSFLNRPKAVPVSRSIVFDGRKLDIKVASRGKVAVSLRTGLPSNSHATVWSHKAVPTLTAAMDLRVDNEMGDAEIDGPKFSLIVHSHGTGAKTALPGKK